MSSYRSLTDAEVQLLVDNGCSSTDWKKVQIADGFKPVRVRDTHFSGDVKIGSNGGEVVSGCVKKIAGIFNAYIDHCTIGNDVRIANVSVHLANYQIGDGVCIENVGTMETRPGATFGNGVEIEVLNEGGGREIILFNTLDSQLAHLMCLHRYRTDLIEKLNAIATEAAESVKSDFGMVGNGATITNVSRITDVNIGCGAKIDGAASLDNGTILSDTDAPTTVGQGVIAEDFIIGEASVVDGGAVVCKSFVGQGCQIGKQYSAEGSVFFANCEGFHGEACSVFAGPYTVSHHKSSLLIACLYSFYNAGSGTNASNHMYKLGPVHEGKLERGTKTGSFSYMMWPCRVGPFSVVLGKHTRAFDTSDFPFSHIEATSEGRCMMIPGFNLSTVGTVRDGAKWPQRDRRKEGYKRDRLSFDVFSPYTVGRMIKGSAILKKLQMETSKEVDTVTVNGAEIKRVLLRSGQKFYRPGIQMYLLEKVITRIEQALDNGNKSITEALATESDAVFSESWVDIGGQLMPQQQLEDFCQAVGNGKIAGLANVASALDTIHANYDKDEWAWVKWAFNEVFEIDLDTADENQIVKIADQFAQVRGKFLQLVLIDATKEFDTQASVGFGQDGSESQVETDFIAVRGEYEANKFVKQMKQEIESVNERVENFKQRLSVVQA